MKKILKSVKYNTNTKIVFYEVWTPMEEPNYYLDIEDIMQNKIDLVRMYPSQLVEGWDYDRWVRGLNEYRSMYVRPSKYGEVYRIIGINSFLKG